MMVNRIQEIYAESKSYGIEKEVFELGQRRYDEMRNDIEPEPPELLEVCLENAFKQIMKIKGYESDL